ncbi:MAG: cytochrome c biogenesis protein DipZ, partial [Paraburkholderia tropica]
GFERAEGFASPGGFAQDRARDYRAPSHPELNHWGLAGEWSVGAEHATLATPGGEIVYRFHARDLHLVLGPGPDGKPVRFRVTVDGKAPEHAHGSDVAPDGVGVITQQRLYQLVRQPGDVADHTFAIQFLDPGVQAFAFTFG